MPDTPATNVETAGVYGQTGAIPVGSMATSGEVKDTTEIGGAGSVTARPESPVLSATPDTEGVYGPNDPGDFSPVSTLLTGTQDTTVGYAASANMAAPVYREPSIGVPVTLYESDRAYGYAEPVPQENYPWVADGTVETASFGAVGGHIITQTDTLTIDATTPALTRPGVIGNAASLVVVNTGQVIQVEDEEHVLTGLDPFELDNLGVVTAVADLVVKKDGTVLTPTTDYTVAATGTGAARKLTVTPVDSDTVDANDTLTVSYAYGNAAYFADDPLVLDTDYTVTFTGGMGERRASILRESGGSAADGDQIEVTYQAGDQVYWGTRIADEEPPAPTLVSVTAGDRKVTITWTNPNLADDDDIDGYLIQSNTDGTRYAPGGVTSFDFEQVVPSQAYIFRVAAFNERGLGEFSDWSDPVSPLHYDEVPPVGLDPRNTINPIYNADGTVVPGTGLGV